MIALAVGAAYLLGGLPSAYLLVRWRHGTDIRLVGSGNPGATNALRVAGVGVGLVSLVLDVLKGYLAVEIGRQLGVVGAGLGAVALAAVLGHVFPIWLSFRGGKGVATAAGSFAALTPAGLAAGMTAFLLVLALTRVVASGSIAAALSVPAATLFAPQSWQGEPGVWPWICLITLLVVGRHHENLRRVWAGTESRLGKKAREA